MKTFEITTEWIDQQILNGCTQKEIQQQFTKTFFPELKKSKNKLTSLEEIIQILQQKGLPAQNIKKEQEGKYAIQIPNNRIHLSYDKQRKTYKLQTSFLYVDITACNAKKIAEMILRLSTEGQAWLDGNLMIKQRCQNREEIHKQFLESDDFINTPYKDLFNYYSQSRDYAGLYALKEHIAKRLTDTLGKTFQTKRAEAGQNWECICTYFDQEHCTAIVDTYTSNGVSGKERIMKTYKHIIIKLENNIYELAGTEEFWDLFGYDSQDYAINVFNYTIQEVVEMIMHSFDCYLNTRKPLPVLPYLANVPPENTLDAVFARCHAFIKENTLSQLKTKAGKETILQLTQEFYNAVKLEIQCMYQYLKKECPDWFPFFLQTMPTNYIVYTNDDYVVSINSLSPFLWESNYLRENILQALPVPAPLNYFDYDFWVRHENAMYACGIINAKNLITPLIFKHNPIWAARLTSNKQIQAENLNEKLKYISQYLKRSQILESLPLIETTQE